MPTPNATADGTPRTAADIEAELMSLPERNDDDSNSSDLNVSQAPSADELTAIRKGWVAKSDYTGDPNKWVDAKTFNERGERFNHNLQREIETLKKRLEGFEGTKEAFKKFSEDALAKKDTELAAAITELRILRTTAIRDGEDETAVALEDRIDLLRDEKKNLKDLPKEVETARTDPGPNANDPVLLEWIDDGNGWFNDDPQLRAYAISVGEELIKKGETVRGRKFLDKVSSMMAEEFPRKFKKAAASAAGSTPNPMDGNSGTSTGARSNVNGGKTERDLPDADLQLMRQFIKEGWMTKEKFLAGYFSR